MVCRRTIAFWSDEVRPPYRNNLPLIINPGMNGLIVILQ
jgi:hypothetical protein